MKAFIIVIAVAIAAFPVFSDDEPGKEPPRPDTSLLEISEAFSVAGFETPSPAAAQDFTLESLDGRDISLASFKGSVVVLNFWATWCGPCKRELSSIQSLYSQLKGRGFVLLGIDYLEEKSEISDFTRGKDLQYPMLMDSFGQVSELYDVQNIPTTIVIDKKGMVVARMVGFDEIPWDSPERSALFERLLSSK